MYVNLCKLVNNTLKTPHTHARTYLTDIIDSIQVSERHSVMIYYISKDQTGDMRSDYPSCCRWGGWQQRDM